MIPAREWNKMLARVISHGFPLPGKNCQRSRTAKGVQVFPDAALFRWRHPWHVAPVWEQKDFRWVATIKPGFVNGIDPTIAASSDNETNAVPLTASPSPRIALPLVEITEAPPAFFARLGVRDPMEGVSLDGAGGVEISDESWRDGLRPPPRRLASCDVVLSIARPALDGEVTVQDAGATGQNLDWTPRLNTVLLEQVGSRPRILSTPKYAPPKAPTALERLLGEATDAQEDTLLLATVYLLSPPNFEGQINGEWAPYVKPAVWWNLAHAARSAKVGDARPITLQTGLVGGMFDRTFNQLLARGNESADRIAAAFDSQSPEGKFWTI